MGKTFKDNQEYKNKRSGIVLGMILSGKTTKVMRDKRDRRKKDNRNHFSREEW